jgi:hypothetical protein
MTVYKIRVIGQVDAQLVGVVRRAHHRNPNRERP